MDINIIKTLSPELASLTITFMFLRYLIISQKEIRDRESVQSNILQDLTRSIKMVLHENNTVMAENTKQLSRLEKSFDRLAAHTAAINKTPTN